MKILNPGEMECEDKSSVFKSEYEGFKSEYEGKTYCFFNSFYRKYKWNLRHHLEFRGGA